MADQRSVTATGDDAERDLPRASRAIGRAVRLAYRAEPRLLLISFFLVAGSWFPEAFAALWLKLLADGITGDRPGTVRLAAAGLATSAALGWLMSTIGSRIEMRFRDRATIAIETHVASLQATVGTIEHHERPGYLNRLQILRDQVFLLNHIYSSLMHAIGSAARILITIGLLVSLHPALSGLAVLSIPTIVVATKRAKAEQRVQEATAPHSRLVSHLFDMATSPGPGKELRVTASIDSLVARRSAERDVWVAALSRNRWTTALWQAAAWTLFAAGYVAAIVFVVEGLDASSGEVLLALAAGANLSRYLATTAGQLSFLRWTIDAAKRLVWLEDYAAEHRRPTQGTVPAALEDGIRFENVSFRYPGTEAWVLEDVDLHLPAGSVVAIVGENGAGKSTLVKLLARFYDPTVGRITADGVDLGTVPAEEWRDRLAGAFQDFFRFEYTAQASIGIGDLARRDDTVAVQAAVARAGAEDVLERLPAGLDTQLGNTWHGGEELSGGQWQKLALARGFMRDEPLLTVLDEPTSALDSETEHALFERFALAAKEAAGAGRITLLVSHRFSTVRMADRIVVLEGSRVVEVGSHAELMARPGGSYAELYSLQASQYR